MATATSFWKELSKIKNLRRRAYFQWKNGIENLKIDYSAMTEDDFIKQCSKSWMGGKITDKEFFLRNMERWESSAEYKRLLFLWEEDKFATDLLAIYSATKKKAIEETDSQAIKNVIMLQKEIKKYRKNIDDFQEQEEKEDEDDGLVI